MMKGGRRSNPRRPLISDSRFTIVKEYLTELVGPAPFSAEPSVHLSVHQSGVSMSIHVSVHMCLQIMYSAENGTTTTYSVNHSLKIVTRREL